MRKRQLIVALAAGFGFTLVFLARPGTVSHAQNSIPTDEMPLPYVECCKNKMPLTNLRSGPNSVFYPLIGTLTLGQLVPALGKSKAGDWVQIKYVGVPSGVAWVYMDNIILHLGPSDLTVVEPPPVPTVFYANTIDSTLAFAFAANYATRLPTYTNAPPYTTPSPPPVDEKSNGGFPIAVLILILLTLGAFGGLFSAALGRH